ncbi:MAG: thiamine diphosphokinase [Oscillospiraceae bacterium]|nr:thiamine diphosphokinase [Oscillospiraceae bacterium]
MGTPITYPCAVLGAGEITDYARVAAFLAPGAFVICADGGFAHCEKLGVRPNLLIGDFDSLGEPPPPGVELITLTTEKDYTDSCHAAEVAVEWGYARILLCGMLGGRLDHTLANLQLLISLAGQGIDALLTDGVTDSYALSGGGWLAVPNREGCYFSVLAFGSCEGVSITGGKYPLEGYPLRADDPRAVSNEFAGRDVVVSQDSGALVVVSQPK